MQHNVSPKDVEKCLKGVDYPAKKADLVNAARQHNANDQVIKALEHLPDKTFDKATDVASAIGKEMRGDM